MADNTDPSESSAAVAKDRSKHKPKKVLPTDRVAFSKQIEILRAYAAGSPDGSKFLTNAEIGGMVAIHPNSVSLCNNFFVESGLLQRGDVGLAPTADVLSYFRTYEWNQESAGEKLAPTLQRTWFAEALLPRAALRVITETEALAVLAEIASADKTYRLQLMCLLDYLELSRLIMRDGSNIRRATRLATVTSYGGAAQQSAEEVRQPANLPVLPSEAKDLRTSHGPANGVNFSVDINVDMAELSGWSADRIAAFFAGLAQVIAAKGSVQDK